MGQAYLHPDEDATEAGRQAHNVIVGLRSNGMSDTSILFGFMAELHSLSEGMLNDMLRNEREETQ